MNPSAALASQRTTQLTPKSIASLSAQLIAVCSLSVALATGANAACPGKTLDAQPLLPNPQSATMEDMLEAQERTRKYVAGIETYLQCRAQIISVQRHNLLVSNAERAARGYNQALQVYLQGDKLLAAEQ
ncbi:MAG: hypothetical protein NXI15_09190 [Gammaproteobacteria bacterium]|nr:hypothetical protein [Gammaproteobacteria bacterium]